MTSGRLMVFLSLCCLPAFAADMYEPDDSFETAKTINIGETQQRSIDPVGDKDYIMFNVATASYCTIESWGAAAYDNYMYLYDSNRYLIASDADSGSGAFAMITRQLTAGAYWVRLEDYGNNNTISSYFVRIESLEPDAYEPDDPSNHAFRVAVNSSLFQQRSWHNDLDRDWYLFTVTDQAGLVLAHTSTYGAVYTLYESVQGTLYTVASFYSYGASAWSRQLQPGTYVLGNQPYNYPEKYVTAFQLWQTTQVPLKCTKLSFKRYLSGKQYPRHKWKLGLQADNVNLESLRGLLLYVTIFNSNNYTSYSLNLPYGRLMEYGRRDLSLRCATMFDVFQAKLTKGNLRLIERISDTSIGGVSAPDSVFCMTDYKYSPIANLTIHIEARRAGIPVFYGDCAVQVRAKYARTAITASTLGKRR
ncbi:MAG: hypothetical protein NTV22_08570 [bacterium]|nr:hypothetical protein [bacterium]